MTSFFRYLQEFRTSPEGQAFMPQGIRAQSAEAGRRWRTFSDEDKKPYITASRVETAAYMEKKRQQKAES